ncbi:MAG: SDR family oxidoreductase [Leadbetterella sp.]
MDFKEKVVWITGASSGIGEALAYEFAAQGAFLVLTARRISELSRVKSELLKHYPSCIVLEFVLDMEKLEDFSQAKDTVMAKFNRIDVLVNNAGISQRSSVMDTDMEVYTKIINLNLLSVIALTKQVLPVFLKQEKGHFVAISSVSGKLGTPMRSGYAASKHALHGFFDCLRAEVFSKNIGVTIACPGYIKTNISVNAMSGDGQKHGKMDDNQLQGLSAQECARKIVYAVSKNKSEIYIGGKEVYGIYLKRFFPKFLENILKKQAPK